MTREELAYLAMGVCRLDRVKTGRVVPTGYVRVTYPYVDVLVRELADAAEFVEAAQRVVAPCGATAVALLLPSPSGGAILTVETPDGRQTWEAGADLEFRPTTPRAPSGVFGRVC